MNDFVDVQGHLFNTETPVYVVHKVEYDRYDDRYEVAINFAVENHRTFRKFFKTEEEAESFRTEFITKMCS